MSPSIDIAVMCQEFSPIQTVPCSQHIVELDEIPIPTNTFRQIFYARDTFCIDPRVQTTTNLNGYISFLYPPRTYRGSPFSLIGELILNLEEDLNVSSNCFTPCSLIDMQKTITSIKTLSDLTCCTMCSLTWSDITALINQDYLRSDMKPVLVVNVVFKSETEGALPTTVKFRYKLENYPPGPVTPPSN